VAATAGVAAAASVITLDDSACRGGGGAPPPSPTSPCKVFAGIGAISGGGATSVLLRPYPDAVRAEILDHLFAPGVGAALHILKVEIGSDAETTDGAEASHMRTPWEEDYERGYEWYLMTEAKARNANITLYGLPWGWPVWVTCDPGTLNNCQGSDPFTHIPSATEYVVKWVSGAQTTWGLDIDVVGAWNEVRGDHGGLAGTPREPPAAHAALTGEPSS
jgi:galactosylceramidase